MSYSLPCLGSEQLTSLNIARSGPLRFYWKYPYMWKGCRNPTCVLHNYKMRCSFLIVYRKFLSSGSKFLRKMFSDSFSSIAPWFKWNEISDIFLAMINLKAISRVILTRVWGKRGERGADGVWGAHRRLMATGDTLDLLLCVYSGFRNRIVGVTLETGGVTWEMYID